MIDKDSLYSSTRTNKIFVLEGHLKLNRELAIQSPAEISIEAGASVPYLRASSLSDDTTPTAPVIADVLQNEAKELYDFCCCIYPCTPLLNVDDLYLSLEHLISKHASFCYPIVEYSHPVQRSLRFGSEGFLQFVESKNELIPTQNFETLVHDAGQFYWGAVPDWTNERKMHSHNAVGYKIPSWRVVDIDTEEDWFRAELIYELLKLQQFGVTHGKL